jgi:hypothetical protein
MTATTTITTKAATGNGDISGYTITCSICGMVWTNSLPSAAQLDAQAHEAWHMRQAKRTKR